MRTLPLYPHRPVLAVEGVEGREVDPGCRLCDLHSGARTVCLPGEGDLGGLLVVGESPGKNEDEIGRPFIGESGRLLRGMISKWWTGPVAIDNAVRCRPGATELKDKHFDACSGYLAETIGEVRPTRIITLGGWAAYAVTGRAVPPFSTRRGYTHLVSGRYGKQSIPVFFVLHPAAALRNRFVRGWLEADMKWALTADPPEGQPLTSAVRVVDSEESARAAVAELRVADWSAFDVETAGVLYEPSFRLLCISFCARGSSSPWAWDGAAIADPATRAVLVELLADARVLKLGTNVKFDEIACDLTLGVKPRGVHGKDVRLWRKLLEPEADARLDKMAELIGMGGIKEEARDEMAEYVDRVRRGLTTERRLAKNAAEDAQLVADGKKAKKRTKLRPEAAEALTYLKSVDADMPSLSPVIRDPERDEESWCYALIPSDMLLRYNGRDSVATARLAEWVRPQFDGQDALDRVRREIVEPGAAAIRSVERWGVPVDRGAVHAFDHYLGQKLADVRTRLDLHGGSEFNADSPKQVGELLFGRLGLRPQRETPSGAYSTDDETLAALSGQHPAVEVISDWRTYSKLKGTYAAGMLTHIRSDGRIHPSILLDGARSGRTSCTAPNLQNIPRAKDSIEGKMARDCFAAKPGFVFIELDYSQLELRIAAMLSGDEDMIAIFNEGVDYHQRTAELVSEIAWGIKPSEVQEMHRSRAKAVNFGILYGKTASTLAREWGVSIAKAETVVSAIMGKFGRLAQWCDERRNEARRTGFSWTWWDGKPARRRPLWRIADADSKSQSTADNGAVNTPIQGTASDFCIASLAASVQWIEEEDLGADVRLVLPVHDSLLFEVRRELADGTAREVRSIMQGWNSNGVPIVVDEKRGTRWGSLQKAA